MRDSKTEAISNQIHHLMHFSHSDFAALALPDKDGRTYKWHYVSGNSNHRYMQMLVKRGRGLPGLALVFGRCITRDLRSVGSNELKIDCPLMIAEGLQAAAAIPIPATSYDCGVLMIGTREAYSYTANDLKYVQDCAKELALLLKADNPKIRQL